MGPLYEHTLSDPLRKRVFQVISAIYFIAPLIGESIIYLASGEASSSLLSSVLISFSAACVYLWFLRTQNLKQSIVIDSVVPFALYTWGLMVSGGLRAEHFIYISVFPMINGFLAGRFAALLTTIFAVFVTVTLAVFEGYQIIPVTSKPLLIVALQACACLIFVGWITMSYEFQRLKTVALSREIQRIARIAGWSLAARTRRIEWSEEMYSIFDVLPERGPPSYQDHLLNIHPEDLDRWKEIIETCLRAGGSFRFRFRAIVSNQVRWIDSLGRAVLDRKGNILGLTGTYHDVTLSVETEDKSRFVLDALHIGIWKWNPNTQELFWDRSMYELFECDPKQFSGHYEAWENSLSEEDRARAVSELKAAVEGDKELDTSFNIVTKSGGQKRIKAKGRVVRDIHGNPLMMYGLNWDISNETRLESQVNIARVKVMHAAKLASLGEMSAGIAHEINNPLAVIEGNLELLSSVRENVEKFEAKREILQRATSRIAKIVSGLRKFSRSSSTSNYKLEFPSEILSEVEILTQPKAKRHCVSIEISVSSESQIACDVVEIEQVLVNLINNAIDAVKSLEEKWIKITVRDDKEEVVFQVIDSGMGIPVELEERIFEPFFTTKDIGEGTGLGLSISKGILDEHHAKFFINRTVEHTCFEIRFKNVSSHKVAELA